MLSSLTLKQVCSAVVIGGTFLFLAVPGCTSAKSTISRRTARELNNTIQDKIDQQQGKADGAQRWEDFKDGAYQDERDITAGTGALRLERKRKDQAAELAAKGPASLVDCIIFSLEFNDEIQAKRAKLRSIGGDSIINMSRFLPHVTYSVHSQRYEVDEASVVPSIDPLLAPAATSTNVTYNTVRVTQRLLEFGRDNPGDVTLREDEREALFAYEDTVRSILTGVRKRFFTILLRMQQREAREKSLIEFQDRFTQVSELEKARRVLEADVLTARLNVLNEQGRINALDKEILRQKMELTHLMGFPTTAITSPAPDTNQTDSATNSIGGWNAVQLAGTVEDFNLTLEEAVTVALKRSAELARRRAVVVEQARKVRESIWDYTPDISAYGGWKDAESMAGLQVTGTDGYYTADSFGETHSDTITGRFGEQLDYLTEDQEGWFFTLEVDVPLFEGFEIMGKKKKEQGLLDQYRHELRSTIEGIETEVGKGYQTVLEQRQEVDILRETVQISRERLRVQERLKELGKISDNELETFRNRYFQDQDTYYGKQIQLVEAQEDLRGFIRYFEPVAAPAAAEQK